MRKLVVICLVSVLGLLLLSRAAPAQEKISLGLSSISATSGSIWVAEEKRLFKKARGESGSHFFYGGRRITRGQRTACR
jgi:hypothetical protein